MLQKISLGYIIIEMKNSEELEKIIYDHARALKSYLICLGVGYSIADDIIQEVFVCFWKQQETKPENVELIVLCLIH